MLLYAQRIRSDGSLFWAENGVPICTADGPQFSQQLIRVNDGSGDVIITWADYRNELTDTDIYAQKIDGGGELQWNPSPSQNAIPGFQVLYLLIGLFSMIIVILHLNKKYYLKI